MNRNVDRVDADASEYSVTSTFASQPVDELHVARLFAAATHLWVVVEEGKDD